MRKLIILLFIICSIQLSAQNQNDAIIVFNGGTSRIMNIQSKPPETKSSVYYNDNWYIGTIKLFSGEEIKDYPLKYDMKMNQIDIKVNETVKVVSIGAVEEIEWVKTNGQVESLINLSNLDNVNIHGLFTVISEGKLSLYKKVELELLESNYNIAVDAGNEDNTYLKKNRYYIYSDNKIHSIKIRKNKILKKFKEKAEQVEEYAEANNLKFNDDNDLKLIFEYYNNL